jgi:cobalt-zinc-cadmium efflux system outer membrane protein
MHRYPASAARLFCIAILFAVAGCAFPTSRENLGAAAQLISKQTGAPLDWRRDEAADQQARVAVDALLTDGVTLDEAVAVAFLASPEPQLALEQLEISRSQLVAASTLPNPAAVLGTREPGGHWAVFYPDRNITIGVLLNFMTLLTLPDRHAVARRDLERASFQAASNITGFAARVAQAWLEYRAALRLEELRGLEMNVVQTATDNRQNASAANADAFDLGLALQRNELFTRQNSLARASIESATAREKLAQLLGIAGWRDNWQISGELPPMPAADLDAALLENAAVEKGLDVRAAATAVDVRLRMLAMQRRFRWLNQFDLGMFRDKVSGGTAFTGPNAVVEVPLFDQRQAQLLNADAELRSAVRNLQLARLNARSEIRIHAQEVRGARALLENYDRSIIPNQQQIALARSREAGNQDDSLRLGQQLITLGLQAEQTGLLRDYWRARSALAVSLGDWPAAQMSR